MEFARIVMLTPHLYERFEVPGYTFSHYEIFQLVVLVLEEILLVVRALFVREWRGLYANVFGCVDDATVASCILCVHCCCCGCRQSIVVILSRFTQ